MQKEILIYHPIYSYSAEAFIASLNENASKDITVRLNCEGGDVLAGWGMIAKFGEFTKKKNIKVDGQARSMAYFMLNYADEVEALEVSEFTIHRAAYPDWIESDPAYFTDADKEGLKRINTFLRQGAEAKVPEYKFKAVTGKSYDEVFSMDGRLNVNISAQQALQMGLISKVTPLTAEKRKEINALAGSVGIAAIHQEIKIQNKMTIQDIQAQHPEAYAAIFNAGKNAESIRVKTILAWHRIDPETTIAMVKDGREMTPDVTAEFQVKGLQAQNIANITADATPNVNPPATATTTATADASVTAFMEGVKANLQRNKIIS